MTTRTRNARCGGEQFVRLAARARKAGWVIRRRPGNHLEWRSPSGHVVYTSATPGDYRTRKNLRAQLRQGGLAV